MAISPQQLTIYLYSAHRAVIFAIAQLSCLSYLHELFVDLNKNCSEYTQGLIDSENVKIRYSLR